MPNSLVTLDTFPNPEHARFIQGLLKSEGVPAYLADETAAGMMWHLNGAIGGIKLQVAEADIPRAQEILEAHRQALADMSPEAFAAEAESSPSADEAPLEAAHVITDRDADDEAPNPTDEMASRAFRAAAIGVVCCPVTVYAVWLIGRLIFSKAELSPRACRNLWLAFAITAATLAGWYFFISAPFH